ncbi:histidine kinase [Christiangramia gaetbulicola]|uniref:Histidine kinase n=1 Tax=Christiangramia gaetbulicola TaxID=703340 RepID=A0A2T6ACI3_9FLAO|nr:histidine kinase [Christiangramia gaetbulicola]PTX41486.1 histidine kinase [Christiangramia gaetbulicola]
MLLREFILSDKKWYRFWRHLFFWLLWGGYFTITRYFNPMVYQTTGKFPDFWKTVVETFFFLFPQTFIVYPALYFILPKFVFKQKFGLAFLWFCVFYLIGITVNAFFLIFVPWSKMPWIPNADLFLTTSTFPQKIFMAYLGSVLGLLTAISLASSFKMFKHYYLKSLRNQQLHKENSEAQLRLLMAQVQPHFMFNTLNNIYSQAQEESPKSAKMIMELAHILRYILDEGKKDRVPLENELQMVVDYLNLEKIRYDQKLDLHYSFPENVSDKVIAPLLLLPLVENCFKHGASKMIHKPWINIKAELNKNSFHIKMMNGRRDKNISVEERKGTGIENVRRRLELLYKDSHSLEIKEDTDVFIVDLKIDLKPLKSEATFIETETLLAYET